MSDSSFDFSTAIIPDAKDSNFDVSTANLGGDAFAAGGFTEPVKETELSFLETVDKSIGDFKVAIGETIKKGIKATFKADLVPEALTNVGASLQQAVSENEGGQVALDFAESTLKGAVIPAGFGEASKRIVEKPAKSTLELGAIYLGAKTPKIVATAANAIAKNPKLLAKWTTQLVLPAVITKQVEKLFPDTLKNVGQLTGLAIGIPVGLMAGSAIVEPKKFLNSLWGGGKEALKKSIVDNADDIVKNVPNGLNLLSEGYDDVYNASVNTLTNETSESLLGKVVPSVRANVKTIIKDLKFIGKQTRGTVPGAGGKFEQQKLTVGVVKQLWSNVNKTIKTGVSRGDDVSNLKEVKTLLQDTMRAVMPKDAVNTLKSLDSLWGTVKNTTTNVMSAITKKVRGADKAVVDTKKLADLLSVKGDLKAKELLDELLQLDETLAPLVKSFMGGMTKWGGFVAKDANNTTNLFARLGGKAFGGLKRTAQTGINIFVLNKLRGLK